MTPENAGKVVEALYRTARVRKIEITRNELRCEYKIDDEVGETRQTAVDGLTVLVHEVLS